MDNKKSIVFHREFIENIPAAVIIHTGEKIVLANNRAVALLCSQPHGTLVGKNIHDFIPSGDSLILSGKNVSIDEITECPGFIKEKLQTETGNMIHVTVSISVVDYENRPSFLLMFTETGENSGELINNNCEKNCSLNEELNVAIEELEATNEELETTNDLLNDTLMEVAETNKKLHASEERLREVFGNMKSGVAIYKAIDDGNDFLFVDLNQAVEKIENIKREDLINKKITETFPGVREFGLLEIFKRVWRTGKPEKQSATFYRDDRIFGWRESYVSKLSSGEIVTVYDDVTEQKIYEENLRVSEKTSRAYLEYSPTAIFIIDAESRFDFVNKSAITLTGYSEEELLGMCVDDFMSVTNADDESLFPQLEKEQKIKTEVTIVKKDQERIIVILDAVKINKMYIAFCTDITARKVAEDAKSRFLAHMSHEIRTPLNGIIGLVELFNTIELNTEQKELLKMIKYSSRSLLEIVNQILDFSQIESGSYKVQMYHFNIKDMLQIIIDTFEKSANNKDLEIQYTMSGDVPEKLYGPRESLRQVIVNLVSNAVKFTEKGHVTVEVSVLEKRGDTFIISFIVEDTGIGIPSALQKTIFDKFTQGDDSFSRKYGGTGLGLSISKELIELAGGELRLKSSKGTGSRFCFTMQFVESADDATEGVYFETDFAYSSHEITSSNADKKILVAEDNDVNRILIEKLLEKKGYSYVSVVNGKEAISAIEQERFALVLMDIQMPVVDGIEATREIRKMRHGKKLPVIALTAHAIKGDREKLLELGLDDYIPKPIYRKQFYDLIEKYM